MNTNISQTAITDFWNWFSENNVRFFHEIEQEQESVFIVVKEKLQKIHPNLVFQFSNILDDGRREFVISADGIRDAFPAVIETHEAAPEFKLWKIIAFRPGMAGEFGIDLEGIKLAKSDIFIRHKRANTMLDIELHIRGYKDSKQFKSAAFLLLDCTLGEYVTETFIGRIDFAPLSEKNILELTPLDAFRDTITRFIQEQAN